MYLGRGKDGNFRTLCAQLSIRQLVAEVSSAEGIDEGLLRSGCVPL